MDIDEDLFRENYLLKPLQEKIENIEKIKEIIKIPLKDDFLLIVEDDVQKVLRIVREVSRVPLSLWEDYIPLEIIIGRRKFDEKMSIKNRISDRNVISFLKDSESMYRCYKKQYKKEKHGESPKQTFIILSHELFGSDLYKEIVTPSISVADARIISSWKWDENQLFDKLMDIKNETIDGIKAGYKGHTSRLIHMFRDHPDTWRLLIDEQHNIVGFWHFLPLSKPMFEKCKMGQLVDDQITSDDIRHLNESGLYDIYVVSVCVKSQFRRIPRSFHFFDSPFDVIQELPYMPVSTLLFDSMFKVFTELAHKKIFIRELCANVFTKSGIETCKRFGLKYIKNHEKYGKIYVGYFPSIIENLKENHELNYLLKSNPDLTELYKTRSL